MDMISIRTLESKLFNKREELEFNTPSTSVERIIKENNLLPINFLEKGIQRSKAVTFILLPNGGATGFLVGKDLLLTNNHVFPDQQTAKAAKILFNFQENISGNPEPVDEYACNPDDFFYTNQQLDYSLVKVNKKESNEAYNGLKNTSTLENAIFPETNAFLPGERWGTIPLLGNTKIQIGKRVNIIQHPAMRRKEIACHDNKIEKLNENFILYTADTEPGSSGSPVFNDKWELIALHHSGGENNNGEWLNNEGVLISSIVNDLLTVLKQSEKGRKILFELRLSGVETCKVEIHADMSGTITCIV
ncbi:MAG: trypsin-like serine peptidase [Bacillota bacterium]